jgi:UDP-N-acetylglucosamine acyltransferase
MATGNTATPHGINTEGLRRRGFSPDALRTLRQAYKVIYRQRLTLEQALEQLEQMRVGCPELQTLIDSLQASTRGIIR